ncbi:MAG: hypothetical protein M3526_01140 [Actinomycetota bacterium]|nr:hypothetical protein [Actinomycetota bacterium]
MIDWLHQVQAAGDPEITIKKLAMLARLSAHKGDYAAADRSSLEAVSLTNGTGFLLFGPRPSLTAARCCA